MRVLFAVALTIFLAVPSLCEEPSDSPLKKPVTLAIKGEALSDLMQMLQAKTGVKLRVSKALADRKATIFVDDKPLQEIMDGLESLFACHWNKKTVDGSTVYEFVSDDKGADKEKQKNDELWKDFETQIARRAELSKKSPDELTKIADAARGTMKSAENPEEIDESRASYDLCEDSDACSHPLYALCLNLYKSLSPAQIQSIKSGKEVWFDSQSDETEWKLPTELANQLFTGYNATYEYNKKRIAKYYHGDEEQPELQKYTPVAVGIRFRVHSDEYSTDLNSTVVYRVEVPTTEFDEEGNEVVGGESTSISTEPCNISLASHSHCDDFERGDDLPFDEEGTLLNQKVTVTLADLEKETKSKVVPGGASEINRSDLLAVLHDKLKLQILADHYSRWYGFADIKDQTVADALESPIGSDGLNCNTYLGQDDEFIYSRYQCMSGTMDETETPNRLLRPWQKAFEKDGCLGLENLADMSSLSDKQLKVLKENADHLGLGRLDEVFEDYNLGYLKLYGLMSARQRKEAFAGGTSVASFSDEQAALLRKAMGGDIWRDDTFEDFDPCVKVGIYKAGKRVDKPASFVPGQRAMPQSIAISTGDADTAYAYEAESSDCSYSGCVLADTEAEAMTKVREDLKDESDQPIVKKLTRLYRQNYNIELKFEGTSETHTLEIPASETYEKSRP